MRDGISQPCCRALRRGPADHDRGTGGSGGIGVTKSRNRSASLPRLRQRPTEPEFVQNPYPFYDRARKLGPLVFWEDYGLPATTTHEATNAFLRDRRFGREEPPEMAAAPPSHTAPFYAVESHSLIQAEPPRHTRLRGRVLRAFTSRRINEMEPEIEALCNQLIDAFPDTEFDLLPAYCSPIPVIVIARLLGVPEEMAPQLLAWSNAMVAMYQARRDRSIEDAAASAAGEFSAFLRSYVDERRASPADDLITHLIASEEAGDRLSTDELVSNCILLLNAGHEATVHTLGNGIRTLAGLGPESEWLSTDSIEATVEEVMRYDPPLHMFTRFAYEEVEAFGHRFQRGDEVACLLAAANRDPAEFARPERFDPRRWPNRQLALGAGIHFCVGAPLARLELRVAFRTLFSRLPRLRLAATSRYANVYHFHGLERLTVSSC